MRRNTVLVNRFKITQLATINSWLFKHGMTPVPVSEIPEFGFIVYGDEGKAVAAAFLRRCEGNLGIFDSMVTDPDARGPARHEALEALVDAILKAAHGLKMTRVMAITRHPSIVERGKSHGFERQALTVMTLEL